jgi:photosystem II stability/assembly factor-like uncharacterized protein
MSKRQLRTAFFAGLISAFISLTASWPGFGRAADATAIDPSLYSALKWRLIGPFRAGRAITASGVPGQPDTYYFGGVGGGVWKTINSGRTWEPIFDSEPISSIGAVTVAPSDPNVIYVGTGEADMRSDISYGDGVYKSTDAGRTWQHVGLDDTRAIGRILVDPHNPDIVLVAALGHPYAPNAERGVFRSTDGGHTWTKVLYKDENTGAVDLNADPETGQVVYASMWAARRPPWSVYAPIEEPGSGLYKSTDGGATWTELRGNGLPEGEVHRIGISVCNGSHGQSVYALIDTAKDADRGLYRSNDGGATWRHVSADSRIDGRAWYFGGVFADPQNPDTVYVANTALYRSTDGGQHFEPIKAAPGGDDYHFLWINPTDSKRMIVASDQGTVVSVDGGVTWSSWYNQPTAQLYHVSTDNDFPYHVYGAQQDSGSIEVASRNDSLSLSFRDSEPTAGGEAGYIAPDSAHADVVIGGGTYGGIDRLWKNTHQTQNISPALGRGRGFGAEPSGCHNGNSYRFTWSSPILFSQNVPEALYFASQVIWKSLDDGTAWQAFSPDLTRPAGGPQPPPTGGPADFEKVTGCGVIYTIAPSPLDASEVWAGTDDGRIQLTRDAGKTWTNVTPPSLSAWSKVSLMEASHFNTGTAYAAIDRHRLDDNAPHVLRTHDFGRTWQEVDAGLPADSYVHAVREDPKRKGLLYAGTETGVFASFDDGDHWQSLQLNLPAAPVRDLVVHGDDLVIATHGRSFWILDDITALRQLNPEVANADAYLFKPEPALRLHPRPFDGTPLPPDEPTAENPPVGAMIDYVLKTEPQGNVTLAIVDAKGKPVRQYSSAEEPPPPPRAPTVTSNWWPRPVLLTKHPGMNRFVWDLRYTPPPGGGRGFFAPRGLMVMPGDYQVRLTVNGHTYEAPLEVRLDPRVNISRAGLERQFAFEQQVLGATTNARDLATAVRDLNAKLAGLEKPMSEKREMADVAREIAKLEQRLKPLLSDESAGGPEEALSMTLPGISGTLSEALSVADSADAPPTATAVAATRQAQTALAAARARWDEIKRQDLPNLNTLLALHHLEKIEVMEDM